MQKAAAEKLRYVLVCQGPRVRLYSAEPQVGVASRSRTETFVELHSGLLTGDRAGYLLALLSAEALTEHGHFDQALASSKLYAAEVARKLRERVYDHVIPAVAKGLAEARNIKTPTATDLADTYRMAMTVLFRLLFIAYAEDKKLLPFGLNGLYDRRSLKEKAKELQQLDREEKPFDAGDNHWQEVAAVFKAVADGNREWGVPIYGGELFETENNDLNATLAGLSLSNEVFGPALQSLLLTDTEHGLAPIDFKTLGVREFGTIYEGLLESELAVAEADLTTDAEGNYRPVKGTEKPVVARGAIYLHNKSGQRKASGTYFTKPFAVDHLLDEALEPALADHLARLDALPNDTDAAEAFFDFRCADIAMGSAHFLVAAVDRIERAFSGYLTRRRLPLVAKELADLRAAAEEKLKDLAITIDEGQLSETQLLRRQIARRCVYGVDLNPTAVTLARLSIWIHTFVPGLPLSFLNHNLVGGNSLVGVGQVGEIAATFHADDTSGLFALDAKKLVGDALDPLKRMAAVVDRTSADIKRMKAALDEAEKAVAPAKAVCDIATACRITGTDFPTRLLDDWDTARQEIVGSEEHGAAEEALAHLPPFHFPVAFPEVFLRDRAGFDVLLGNPPWEKAQVEEHGFWARHFPGLRSVSQREREAKYKELRDDRPELQNLLETETAEAEGLRLALMNGPYPGMGSGHPDLFKAFAWRFWHLAATGGRFGVVLPRGALAAKGSELFRKAVFAGAADVAVTTLVNNRTWVFDGVHPQYTVGLVAVTRGGLSPSPAGERGTQQSIGLRGPFNSLDRFAEHHRRPLTRFAPADVLSWTDTASLPLLPAEESLAVFAQLRTHPRLDTNDGKTWRARPLQGDMNSTSDKHLMNLVSEEQPHGFWPVFKGASFDLWEPDAGPGSYYAWADPKVVLPELLETQKRGARSKASPFSEFDPKKLGKKDRLPCQFARIAFRDVTRATDSRTMRCALIPPRVFLVHTAPCLLFPRGDASDVAYLLGVLSSLPLDWYARRFVETHMTFGVINPFPIPRPGRDDPNRLRVVALAGRLAAVDDRYAEWAEREGVDCGPLDPADKDAHLHELDAVVAHLYGLSEAHLRHVFETFHEGRAYHERLEQTLKWFHQWE